MFSRRLRYLFTVLISVVLALTAQPTFAQDASYPGKPSWWESSIRLIGSKPDHRQRLWFTASQAGNYRIKIWWGQDIDPDGTRSFDCGTGECQTGETGHVTLNGTTPDAAIYSIADGRRGWYLGYTEIEKTLAVGDAIYAIYGSMEYSINVYVEVQLIPPEATPAPPIMPSFSCVMPNTVGLEWGYYYLHEVKPQNRIVHVKHEGIVISPLAYAQDWENDGLPHPILDEEGHILMTFTITYHYDEQGSIGYVECALPQPELSQRGPQVSPSQTQSPQPMSTFTATSLPVVSTPVVQQPYSCSSQETIVSTAYDPQLYDVMAKSTDDEPQKMWELVRYDVIDEDGEQVVVLSDILTEGARYDDVYFREVVSLEPTQNCIIATIATPIETRTSEETAPRKVYFMDYGGYLLSTLEGEQYDYVHVEWTANYTVIAVRREQQPDGTWSDPRAYLTDRTGSFWVPLGEGTSHQSLINSRTGEPIIAYTTLHHTLAFMTLRYHEVDHTWDTGLASDRAEWIPDGSGIFIKTQDTYHMLVFDNTPDTLYTETFEAIDLAIDPDNDGDAIVSTPTMQTSSEPIPELNRLELEVDPVALPINSDWVDPQHGIYEANPVPIFNFLNALRIANQADEIKYARFKMDR
ncbi:hypothetical protein G4Y79_06830 [Phototrophicus methaneseepsis]|uniref:Uncharacterized protein n=1 Tax=Phototrophicus methaneseepsis TaxID=2710758 RepID=A0A7S8IFY5_9CHLR|nr:hypothetical protein [Phototrophicus methaneseepsis]QPC84087.1 hypothetical protein G4Y79_06830 [Phototrophicus methaneseepsis]